VREFSRAIEGAVKAGEEGGDGKSLKLIRRQFSLKGERIIKNPSMRVLGKKEQSLQL